MKTVVDLQGLSDRGQRNLNRLAQGVSSGTSKTVDALEENLSELVKETQKLGRTEGGVTPDQRRFTAAKKLMADGTTKLAGGLDNLYAQYMDQARHLDILGRAGTGLSSSLMSLGDSVESTAGKMALIGSGALVGALTATFGMFYNVLMDTTNLLRDMNDVGLRQIRDSETLRGNLRELTMTSDQFNQVMTKYSTTMGLFGQDSLARLVGRSTDLSDRFRELGITTAESAEYAAEFLEQQRILGVFRNQDERAQSLALRESVEQLNAFSAIMNVSRRAIQQQVTEQARDARLRSAQLMLESTGRENLRAAFTEGSMLFGAMGEQGHLLQEVFTTMMGSFQDPMTALADFGDLMPQFGNEMIEMANLVRRIRSGENFEEDEVVTALLEIFAGANRANISMMGATSDQAARLGSFYLDLEQVMHRLGQEGGSVSEALQNMRAEAPTMAQAAVEFQDTLNEARRAFEYNVIKAAKILFSDEGDDVFSSALMGASGVIRSFTTEMDNFMKTWEQDGFIAAFHQAGVNLVDYIGVQMPIWGRAFRQGMMTIFHDDNIVNRGWRRLMGAADSETTTAGTQAAENFVGILTDSMMSILPSKRREVAERWQTLHEADEFGPIASAVTMPARIEMGIIQRREQVAEIERTILDQAQIEDQGDFNSNIRHLRDERDRILEEYFQNETLSSREMTRLLAALAEKMDEAITEQRRLRRETVGP